MQYNIGETISEGLYKGYKVINIEQVDKYDTYILEDNNKEIHKVIAGYIDLGLNHNDSDLLIDINNLVYKNLIEICFQNPATGTFREDKTYVYIDLTRKGLKKGDLVMAYSPGRTKIEGIEDREELIGLMHKTKCKVVKTYGISKKKIQKEYLQQNKKYIIGINEHIDNDCYIIDSIDYALDYINGRLPRIKAGINPKTNELYLWELARSRKAKLSKSESIQLSENKLNTKNKFNQIGALCYSLLEKGNQPYQIYSYLIENKLITESEEYSRDQLNKYFYYSSIFYCDNIAAYKSLMSSLENISNSIRLSNVNILNKLRSLYNDSLDYIDIYEQEYTSIVNKRNEIIDNLKSNYNKEISQKIYQELDIINDAILDLDKKYCDIAIAKKLVQNKNLIEELLQKLL